MTVSTVALARGLGVSRQAVMKRIRRGMPQTSLEAAIAWTRANVDPSRGKIPALPAGGPTDPVPPPTLGGLIEDALDDWRGNRLPLLMHLAPLDAAAVRAGGVDLAVWEKIHRDFVESPDAWPLMIQHLLARARAGAS